MSSHPPACVIDVGTGYTKMGYAGNVEPSHIIPSAIATKPNVGGGVSGGYVGGHRGEDLDFFIGDDAFLNKNYDVKYPLRHGIVEDWDLMERFMSRCIYKHLRADPEEHFFMLTEPPLNTPENREYLAEMMFESFNVPGMYIAVQAVCALASLWIDREREKSLTGVVIDSGDGVTHVVPVSDGYVIGSCIKHIPIAGRDVTVFIQQLLRDRHEPNTTMEFAKDIKEKHGYVCRDIAKEFSKFDNHSGGGEGGGGKFKKIYDASTKETSEVGYEAFLGPEVFFHPEFANPAFTESISSVVDRTIQACPIDTRRDLYKNVILSGGSTMFKNFGQRLQRDVNRLVKARHELQDVKGTPLEVNVISSRIQRYAVWFGGSLISAAPDFYTHSHTREQYQEYGPSIARYNKIFKVL